MKKLLLVFAAAAAAVCGAAESQEVVALRESVSGAGAGAVVEVPAGNYLLEAPLVVDKAITLKGADRATTIFDGHGRTSVIELSNGAVLSGVTVQNGVQRWVSATVGGAAGVFASGATITNCLVRDCTATAVSEMTEGVNGGGVYMTGSSLLVNSEVTGCLLVHPASYVSTAKRQYPSGGGVYASSSTVRGTFVHGNGIRVYGKKGTNFESGSHFRGGGVCLAGSGAVLEESRLVGNSCTNCCGSGAGTYFDGGGVYAGSGAKVSQCLCATNFAVVGCGVYAGSESTVVDTTVRGNIAPSDTSWFGYSDGGAIYISTTLPVSGCLFEDNYSYRYGPVALTAAGAVLSNCVIRSGRANSGGNVEICASGCLVTHCLFEKSVNVTLVNQRSVGCLFRDCVFSGCSDTGNGYSSLFSFCAGPYSSDSDTVRFRNCLFYGNTFGCWCYQNGLSGSADFWCELDGCSFIGNVFKGTLLYYKTYYNGSTAEANTAAWNAFHVKNTLFHKNVPIASSTALQDLFAGKVTAAGVCQYNFGYGQKMPSDDHNIVDVENPGFTDEDAPNFSPTRKSALVDKGDPSDWMTGAKDMGEGLFAVVANGSYGVRLEKCNAHVRIAPKKSGVPDIGCCEYYCAPGLMLIFR